MHIDQSVVDNLLGGADWIYCWQSETPIWYRLEFMEVEATAKWNKDSNIRKKIWFIGNRRDKEVVGRIEPRLDWYHLIEYSELIIVNRIGECAESDQNGRSSNRNRVDSL